METQRYRVVLTGVLHPGSTPEAAVSVLAEVFQAPASSLRGIFDGAERPVDQALSAEDALKLQERLDRVGVRTRIQRESNPQVPLKLRQGVARSNTAVSGAPVSQAGMMNCPACGHRQLVSGRCEACGILFDGYDPASGSPAQATQVQQTSPQANAPNGQASGAHGHAAKQGWDNDWLDSEEDGGPDEQHHLALFFGRPPDYYLKTCPSYLAGPRARFGLGWNWAAVFSPFAWSLYRKMWGWSLVIFVTEILLPVLLIVLGSYGFGPEKLVQLGYAGLLMNRLVWPALANFLYCRHALKTVQRLHMMSPNYVAEIDIATAGGVSNSSVFVGLAVATVMGVFLWSLVDSVHQSNRFGQLPAGLDAARGGRADPKGAGGPGQDDMTGLAGAQLPAQNKWVATRLKLGAIGQKANAWLAERPDSGPSDLSMSRLREAYALGVADSRDSWGGAVQFIPDDQGCRLLSAGPDGLFGTVDDIQYRRPLKEPGL